MGVLVPSILDIYRLQSYSCFHSFNLPLSIPARLDNHQPSPCDSLKFNSNNSFSSTNLLPLVASFVNPLVYFDSTTPIAHTELLEVMEAFILTVVFP